jgi:hypothetical protein
MAWHDACLFFYIDSVPRHRQLSPKDGMMRFHDERERRLRPIRPLEPPARSPKFVLHHREILGQRPHKSRCVHSELWSQEDGVSVDSPMITACYEAHLAMKKMLAAFAELRGDDVEDEFA